MLRIIFSLFLTSTVLIAQPFSFNDLSVYKNDSSGGAACVTNLLAFTLQTTLSSGADTTAYGTPAFTPASNSTLIAFFGYTPDTTTVTLTNTGATQFTWWNAVSTNGSTGRTMAWVTQLPSGTSPFSMQLVFVGNVNITGGEVHVIQVTGADRSASWGTNAVRSVGAWQTGGISSTTREMFFGFTPEASGSNTVIYAVNYQSGGSGTMTPQSPFVELADTSHSSPFWSMNCAYRTNIPSTVTSVWQTNQFANAGWVTAFLEIKASITCP